jgi:hypothetical protein
MSNNVAIDVAIGLVFIFLLYSLLATTVQEMIARSYSLRGRMLVKGVRTMLEDRHEDYHWLFRGIKRMVVSFFKDIKHFSCPFPYNSLSRKFYQHPNIKYLSESSWNNKPSYIGPENFSDTMIRILRTTSYDGSKDQMELIRKTLDYWKQKKYNQAADNIVADALINHAYDGAKRNSTDQHDKTPLDILKLTLPKCTDEERYKDDEGKRLWQNIINNIEIIVARGKNKKTGKDAKWWIRLWQYITNDIAYAIFTPDKKEKTNNEIKKELRKWLQAVHYRSLDFLKGSVTEVQFESKKTKQAPGPKNIVAILDGQPIVIGEETLEQLLHLSYDAQKDILRFKVLLEKWFNHSMDRVTGWYKKQNQLMLLFTGLFIAWSFNVDSIAIYKVLAKDKNARDGMVRIAIAKNDKMQKIVKKINTGTASDTTTYADSTYRLLAKDAEEVNNILGMGKPYKNTLDKYQDSVDKYADEKNNILKKIEKTLQKDCWFVLRCTDEEQVEKFKDTSKEYKRLHTILAQHRNILNEKKKKYGNCLVYCDKQKNWSTTLAGWFITAFAISLGAPFWFDLLNKVIQLRSAGNKSDADKKNGPASVNNTTNNTTTTPPTLLRKG